MKKSSLIIALLVITTSFNVIGQNAPEPNIAKFFPGLSWKEYVQKKAIVMYLDYNDKSKLIPADCKFLLNSAEEKDSIFAQEAINYFNDVQNLNKATAWVNSYIRKYPFVKQQVASDNIKQLITEEFSGILPQAEIDQMDLDNMANTKVVVEKVTDSKTQVKKK